jgi:hypothetical protein
MSAVEAEVLAQKQPRTAEQIIRRMFDIRNRKRRVSAIEKKLNAEWDSLKAEILAKIREQGEGMKAISSKLGTASITEEIVPHVDDWDQVWEYMKENDALHLVQKRVATGAFRELIESGQEVPGMRPVPKIDISLTAARR